MIDYRIEHHCFHGTTDKATRDIIKDKRFTINKRSNHWLGNGAYFFLNDFSKAEWWANNAVKNELKKNSSSTVAPSILYVPARMSKIELLDLNTEDGQMILVRFQKKLEQMNIRVKINNTHEYTEEEMTRITLCHALDFMHKLVKIKAASYTFQNAGKPFFFGDLKAYGIMNNRGQQICIFEQSTLDFEKMEKII